MAIFIPVGQTRDYNGSAGEKMVYRALEKLPDDYFVFYSLKWGRKYRGHYQRGETDFLIFDPTRGFLVVEVKTSGIRRDEDGRWYSVGHDGEEHELKMSPLDQAQRSADYYADLLAGSQNDVVRDYDLEPVVWFPSLKLAELSGKLPSEYQSSNMFTEDELEDAELAVERAFRNYGMERLFNKAPKQLIDEVIQMFAPTFRIVPSLSSEVKKRDFMFNELTNEQASLLDYLGEQHVAGIHGVSGTGKTMIALECARRLPKEANVLFLCFNRLLLQYLRDNFGEEMPNVTFANLNQLYAREHGRENATVEEITDFLLESFNDNYQFEHIIVDEGQDFAADHLDFLLATVRAVGGYFYVFYDEKQLVHKWDRETTDWLGKLSCRLVLNKNCRNTYEIARTSYAPVEIEDVVLAEGIKGDVPCLNNYASVERAIQGIGETIRFYHREKGFSLEQITVLTLKTLEKTMLCGCDSVGDYRLTNELGGDGVLFTTARKFKGLESDVVIVIDIDGDTFKDENSRNVFYVASSRAKHCLTYIAALSEEEMGKMVEELSDVEGDSGGVSHRLASGDAKRALSQMLNVDVQEVE